MRGGTAVEGGRMCGPGEGDRADCGVRGGECEENPEELLTLTAKHDTMEMTQEQTFWRAFRRGLGQLARARSLDDVRRGAQALQDLLERDKCGRPASR